MPSILLSSIRCLINKIPIDKKLSPFNYFKLNYFFPVSRNTLPPIDWNFFSHA